VVALVIAASAAGGSLYSSFSVTSLGATEIGYQVSVPGISNNATQLYWLAIG
jgi:hypothetical protein